MMAAGCGDDGSASSSATGTDGSGLTTSARPTDTTANGTADPSDSMTNTATAATGPGDPTAADDTTTGPPPVDGAASLRFYGNGGLYDDRVLIPIDDPANADPGPPIDVGAGPFTIEFWIRPDPAGNPNPALQCGSTNDWVTSNIVLDRDRHSQGRSYGIGIAGGVMVFAVNNSDDAAWTMCGTTDVLDDQWHHIAAQRRASDGMMWIYVDGLLDAMEIGLPGDISYPDDGEPMNVCPGGLCDYSDPFISIGAEKHGYESISYDGYFDELRVSTVIRYEADFAVPEGPWRPDADTVGLYHFDEGRGATTADASAVPTHGAIQYGGDPPGPDWSTETPF